ncbi:hypothetical protein FACS189463_2880 [Bacteroidia bacterium]|nr:hypothetical protein FACS189463_2880 [Bacteroidia bacterium]
MAIIALLAVSAQAQSKIVYDFNDGSWGEAVEERPESGTFGNQVINEVKFNQAVVYQKDGKGKTRVILDKASLKSQVEFPAFEEGKKEVLLDVSVGTEEKTFILEEKVNNKWSAAGSLVVATKEKTTYTLNISEEATQIRIKNATSSSLYLWKVIIK